MMKKAALERLFKQNGWKFDRNGGNHDVWVKGNAKSMKYLQKR